MPAAAERNFESRTLYHGDNLPFLRGMNSGTVDLIATDPPFNKSKDFHATPDSIAKSNTLTLEGLRRHNRANGWMAKG